MRKSHEVHRIRSFVGRNSRITDAQAHALQEDWKTYGLNPDDEDNQRFFSSQKGKLYVEIGFGGGQSLIACAKAFPDDFFIGIEPHKPGVGALFIGLKRDGIRNVKVFSGDAVVLLENEFNDESIDGVHIFFPDPWQKRKHHERRLIQTEFLDLVCRKLKIGGHLHLATDWDDYAKHMNRVLNAHPLLVKEGSVRSCFRPVTTKFEARSIRENRVTTEFQFVKMNHTNFKEKDGS